MDSTVLFDIATKPFDWSALVPPLGLFLFGAFGVWMEHRGTGKVVIRRIGLILCFAGILFAAFVATSWLVKQHGYIRALHSDNHSVAEGLVTGFHAMPYEGHSEEQFTIANERFSYSDYVVTPCFNHSVSHGGPAIRDGMYLRVSYVDDCILRIEASSPKLE
jgi:hypothetical protein